LLFHADSSPELLSTTLLLDHTGALFVGETRLAHAPLLLGVGNDEKDEDDSADDSEDEDKDKGTDDGVGRRAGGWHHVAVVVSLAHQAEQSEYRVFLDGTEVAALRHSPLLDLSAVRWISMYRNFPAVHAVDSSHSHCRCNRRSFY
jgi:hypothetical protein